MIVPLFGALVFMVVVVFTATQIIMPLLRDDPLLPALRDKPALVKEAEDSLLAAQAANKAAEIEIEVARLNSETRTLNIQLDEEEKNN